MQIFYNLVFSQQMAKEVRFGAVAAQPYLQKSETLGNDTEMSHELHIHLSTILHACFDWYFNQCFWWSEVLVLIQLSICVCIWNNMCKKRENPWKRKKNINVVLVTYSIAALSRPCPSFEFNCFYLKEKFAHLHFTGSVYTCWKCKSLENQYF